MKNLPENSKFSIREHRKKTMEYATSRTNKKIGYRLKHLEIFKKSILKRWNRYRKRPTDAEYLTRNQNANDSLENHVQNVQN